VELPTYTNIWKIEKRLYKLYDFRLPMPLPVGQVTAFLAVAVPYAIVLAMAGAPFSHTWLWVYVLPPGVLAWLITRPVLEGKRLPELVLSQLRYLSEPQTWCRMAPLAEPDEISVMARVWRWTPAQSVAELPLAEASATARTDKQQVLAPNAGTAEAAGSVETNEPEAKIVAATESNGIAEPGGTAAQSGTPESATAGVAAGRPAPWPAPGMPAPASIFRSASHAGSAANSGSAANAGESAAVPGGKAPTPASARARATASGEARPDADGGRVRARDRGTAHRPVVTVKGGPPHLVERALRGSPGGRDQTLALPGGHRPGKPDQVQLDRARARQPVAGPARIVVLGCTAGAGQTLTTLLAGTLLASLRGEPVAVVDLSPGPGSLYEQARAMPRMLAGLRNTDRPAGASGSCAPAPGAESCTGAMRPGQAQERGLQVVAADDPGQDAASLIDAVVARYPLTIADPSGGNVAPALQAADQLMLVAPASQDAPGSLAMTLEWLEAHGHDRLARAAVTVLTGFSAATMQHVDKAAAVASGRCRAIVRVPWDEQLATLARPLPPTGHDSGHQPLGAAAIQAYTALAAVLVSALAESVQARSPQ
jgi:hypothetical protein